MNKYPYQQANEFPIRIGDFRSLLRVIVFGLWMSASMMIMAAELVLPDGIETYQDEGKPVEELYGAYLSLIERGWKLEVITWSQPQGRAYALAGVSSLKENGFPLKVGGQTQFGEDITGGIIGPVIDGSIDELMSADVIILAGRQQPGPVAHTVLAFETPADQIPFGGASKRMPPC